MKKRTNLSVRFAEKSDAEEVLSLALEYEKGNIDKTALLETFKNILESPDYLLAVLVDDDELKIIGFAVMLKILSLFDAPKAHYRIDMVLIKGTDRLLAPLLEFLEKDRLSVVPSVSVPTSFSLTTRKSKLLFLSRLATCQ